MALSPLRPESGRVSVSETRTFETSRTWRIDFENGRIREVIDGEPALRQFIRKAIMTARYRFVIYDDQYGSEVDRLIGAYDATDALIRAELPRLIREALIYDDRIANVDNFTFEQRGDAIYVTFTVTTTSGFSFNEGVVIGGDQ